jgi:tRNA (cytidine/uridine-2'-O-)-methyltransferase
MSDVEGQLGLCARPSQNVESGDSHIIICGTSFESYRLASVDRYPELLGYFAPHRYDSRMKDYPPQLNIVLYQPEIPGNTGAVGRTCVALGCKLWLVRPLGFRVDEKTLRRAGLDYWQHLNWEVVDHWTALTEQLAATRFWFFSKRSDRIFSEVQFARGDTLVFGSETNGLPDSFLELYPEQFLKLPIRQDVRSLNLSCSVAVAGYEAMRQISAGDFSWADG